MKEFSTDHRIRYMKRLIDTMRKSLPEYFIFDEEISLCYALSLPNKMLWCVKK